MDITISLVWFIHFLLLAVFFSVSSAVESEDTGYAGLHTSSYQNELLPTDYKKDKQKVSLKKKKMKNRMEADIVR